MIMIGALVGMLQSSYDRVALLFYDRTLSSMACNECVEARFSVASMKIQDDRLVPTGTVLYSFSSPCFLRRARHDSLNLMGSSSSVTVLQRML
jgi:hypothetical protein